MAKFEGTAEDIVFRNDANGWTVAGFRIEGLGRISAVGVMPFLNPGERVILDGELTEHKEYGQQIRVDSYELCRPETKSAVEKYLASGLIKGIGAKTAKLIVDHFGTDALDILETQPSKLTEIAGIGAKRAAMISENFAKQNGMRMALMFLQGIGLSPNMSMKVYRAYGDKTEAVLRGNPYRLADEIEGVGFTTADRIARGMGLGVDAPERLRSGIRYVLTEAVNRSGHIYLPEAELAERSTQILGVGAEQVACTLNELTASHSLIEEKVEGVSAVYLPHLYRAECQAAMLMLDRLRQAKASTLSDGDVQREISEYELSAGVELSTLQRDAVVSAATEGICIITGGPGTGKTMSINCILRILETRGSVELCAPTGRAAKRMSESTGRTARMIHRMLEYSGEGGEFQRDEENPLEADAIIVDEMSMVDIFLLRALLRALKRGAKLVLVGDADQLPSVGVGNVLRDLISSGTLPVVRLTEIFRQGRQSHIIINAHRINHGQYPIIVNRNTDFFLERKDNAQAVAASVVALVKERVPGYLGVDRLRGIQVMAPMKKGALGVIQLNAELQAALNPPAPNRPELNRGESCFRLGDKVMQIRNNYDIGWNRGDEEGSGAFNGDIGFIAELDPEERELTVEFDDGRRAVYGDDMLDELELSYCISVHKSQGSEFEAVVLPLLSGPPMLMTRNLLYTAVTRARRMVVLVGREECVHRMVDNNHILKRYSALAQRLRVEE